MRQFASETQQLRIGEYADHMVDYFTFESECVAKLQILSMQKDSESVEIIRETIAIIQTLKKRIEENIERGNEINALNREHSHEQIDSRLCYGIYKKIFTTIRKLIELIAKNNNFEAKIYGVWIQICNLRIGLNPINGECCFKYTHQFSRLVHNVGIYEIIEIR